MNPALEIEQRVLDYLRTKRGQFVPRFHMTVALARELRHPIPQVMRVVNSLIQRKQLVLKSLGKVSCVRISELVA